MRLSTELTHGNSPLAELITHSLLAQIGLLRFVGLPHLVHIQICYAEVLWNMSSSKSGKIK